MTIDKTTVICVAIIMFFGFLCSIIWNSQSKKPLYADTNGKIVSEKIWIMGDMRIFNQAIQFPKYVKNPKALYIVGNGQDLFNNTGEFR